MSQPENVDCDSKVKNVISEDPIKSEDEQVKDAVVSNASELVDPAILAVREVPKFRYTKEELINLRETPLSRKKPDFINTDAVPVTIWDQEHWNDRKKSTTPTDSSTRNEQQQQQPDNRRRPGDPRERIRKENDGIILSPQRRSFNTGCFVPMREQPQPRVGGRPHSPISGKGDAPHMNMREIQTGGNRRIGSGRILRDSWDFNEKIDGGDSDYYRNVQEDRRPFKREFDMSKDMKDRRNSGGRYTGRRISGGEKDEEPEWFSGGPLSQNDTIELRGFEESEKAGNINKKKLSSSQAKRVREWAKKKTSTEDKLEEEPCVEQKPKQVEAKENVRDNETAKQTKQDTGATKENATSNNIQSASTGSENINEHSFLFDDIFKCDSIPGLLTNGVEGTADNNTKSRFSHWFQQQSPEKLTESRRSSLQEEHFLKNLLNDITEPAKVTIPPQLGNSESYFAPISPAAVNASGGEPGTPRPGQINIAEIFQRGKHEQTKSGVDGDILNNIKAQFPGKVMSLNELESRMRKSADISGNHSQSKTLPAQEDDLSAFKRLLSQVSGGHVVTANNGSAAHQKMPPMTLMEMLSHSQQQEEVQARINQQSQLVGPSSPKPQPLGVLHNEFILKMQQAQQEQQAQLQRQQHVNMLNKLMGLHSVASAQHLRASPLHDLAQQQSRELLSRPEAQAILQGLKRGDITPQHLYQQLANPALQPRHREMLYVILKMQRMGPSPRVLSPVPPPHHMFPQQQQLRVSPLPNAYCVSPIMATSPNTLTVPAMHQRIPSPRELQVHTQNILQRALIKKMLEEQQENFRKKQEMQQPGHSPNNTGSSNKNVSSPTPLAFTPTSVLRKMTADKDDGNKEVKNSETNKFSQGRAVVGARFQQQQANQWNNQYHMKQSGRPIVKANSMYQNNGPEQFFNAQQSQQFLYNQHQSRQQPINQQQSGGGTGQYSQSKQVQQNQASSSMGNLGQYSSQSNQQLPQLTQQQLRAQHQQQARPAVSNQSTIQQQQTQQKPQNFSQPQQHQQQSTAWQQFLNAAAQQGSRNQTGCDGDGDLSPTTTNQLARWFSSDLLERARIGELPSTAGLAEHALSLEEIERQPAPPVHN